MAVLFAEFKLYFKMGSKFEFRAAHTHQKIPGCPHRVRLLDSLRVFRELEIIAYQGRRRQREAIHNEKEIKDGFKCMILRRIAFEKFEKFRLNVSKLSSVTELL